MSSTKYKCTVNYLESSVMFWCEFTGYKRLVRFADKLFNFTIEAIVLFPIILYESPSPSNSVVRRQRIHLLQQLETLVIFYYIIYWADFWYAYYHYRDFELSHMKVRFEQEAIMDVCLDRKRELFGWLSFRISRDV